MATYVVLLRGINVGGKNKLPMAELKRHLEEQGFEDVITYIQSGNVILRSRLDAPSLRAELESLLVRVFRLDTSVRVLVLDREAYGSVVSDAPRGFGQDEAYRDNVLFLMDVDPASVKEQIAARPGVDQVWQGSRAIYYRYEVAQASKSFISKLSSLPVYSSLTVRNWNTTVKLLALLET